jgi:hypothetical protein
MADIRFDRPITSYAKVQAFLSPIMRGKKWTIRRNRIKDKVLLNVGCGYNPMDNFINLNYEWNPGIDICWDITAERIPLPSDSLEGVYTEHCLEHIPFEKCVETVKEFYRLLKPGGTVRIIVPDGQIYFDLYQAKKKLTNPCSCLMLKMRKRLPSALTGSSGGTGIYLFMTLRPWPYFFKKQVSAT